MVKTKTKAKKGKNIIGFVYMLVGCALMYTLFSNAMTIYQRQKDIAVLEKQRETLMKEKEDLENELELLSDDDYITRYARENYVFTREGEQVAIIPNVGTEE